MGACPQEYRELTPRQQERGEYGLDNSERTDSSLDLDESGRSTTHDCAHFWVDL